MRLPMLVLLLAPLALMGGERRVATWEGIAGQDWLVVLKDDRATYAVAPPLKDEQDAAFLTKKYGASETRTAGSISGDVVRSWEILDYPGKRRMFLRRPGETAVVARVIYR